LSDGFLRKDAEIAGVNSKLESEQTLVAQLQKKIKELQVGIRRYPPRDFPHQRRLFQAFFKKGGFTPLLKKCLE